jgi:iron complex outermembrane receptor protein
MQHKWLSFVLLLIVRLSVFGQYNQDIKIVDIENNQALFGVNVIIESLGKGVVSNEKGFATFTDLPSGTYDLKFSYLGFETQILKVNIPNKDTLIVSLVESEDRLEEVVLQATRSKRVIERIPTRVEYIGSEELTEKVTMNPANISMVLRESTGIQMQQTSLSSGNSNIKIQGLDGRFTQLLRDGFPLYSGFSSGLSIMQIPPVDLKRFEIIKGSSSTLYGGGAIAGLVNMVSKTPESDPQLDIMLTQTQALGSVANVFYAERENKFGWTVFAGAQFQKAYDAEEDGFSNLPKTNSYTFNPKLFYYPSEKTTLWFGLNGTYDLRSGGDMLALEQGASQDNSYIEQNRSKRISTQLVYESELKENRILSFRNSLSYFNRALNIPDFSFTGNQWNSFSELTYQMEFDKVELDLGTNVYSSSFKEQETSSPRDQKDLTFGLFSNVLTDLSENWILETGLRTDYSKDWGTFVLPRISLWYNSPGGLSARVGGGLGYKIPDLFTEDAERLNYQNILSIDKEVLDAERSYGVNLDFNYQASLVGDLRVSFNQLFYLTAIQDALLLNKTAEDTYKYENASGPILSKGAETNIKFSFRDFRWFLNYAFIDARLNYLPGNPQKPLTPKHNAGSVLMYEGEQWRIGLETYYTGKQVLSDGSLTPDYTTMGLLVVRNFAWGSTYVNIENLTNVLQSDFGPLVSPPMDRPVFAEIYAPTDGFILSVGVIIKPFGNSHEHH